MKMKIKNQLNQIKNKVQSIDWKNLVNRVKNQLNQIKNELNQIKNKIQNIDWKKTKKDFPKIIMSIDYYKESPLPGITKYYLTKDRS
jgi:chromosome segregation ATPase